jgi:flavin reductase (DIM6/NTAB) family NADH-FMN oxidoreductase RutF
VTQIESENRQPVDVALYRRAVGRFATGICVVTTRIGDLDHAMTVNAFTSVSLEPVLVLVCVELEARFHDAVTEAGFWGVSVLDGDSRRVADRLSQRGRPLHDQLVSVPHRPGPVTGAALLDGALATLECRTTAVHPAGDHSIVVGEVVGVTLPDEMDDALLYHRGAYRRLPATG